MFAFFIKMYQKKKNILWKKLCFPSRWPKDIDKKNSLFFMEKSLNFRGFENCLY